MTKAQKAQYESLISENYHTHDLLPPLWQVIYQESIRANHILFHIDDVKTFMEEPPRTDRRTLEKATSNHLRETAYAIFTAQSLLDMRTIIESLDLASRRMIFKIYLNLMLQLKKDVKAGLN